MQQFHWLDQLNIRGTFGYNGNVDKSTSFLPLINITGALNPFIHETIGTISSYGNPSLRWEKASTVNVGMDFSAFHGKLFGSLDVYDKRSIDLIVTQSIASVNGTSSQKFNNGEMTNKGVEVRLGTTLPIFGDEITWTELLIMLTIRTGLLNFTNLHTRCMICTLEVPLHTPKDMMLILYGHCVMPEWII